MASRTTRPLRLARPVAFAIAVLSVLSLTVTVPALARNVPAQSPVTAIASTVPIDTKNEPGAASESIAADGPVSTHPAVASARRPAATTIRSTTRPTVVRASARTSHPKTRVAAPKVTHRASTTRHTSGTVHRGRNHVWIPTLGINRSVSSFSCTRSQPPNNYVYRWGCAGRNNVYLLGHAYGVFKPLHDAYVSGRLHKGMRAWYADATGRVHEYAVAWWRVTAPTTSASWAWAAQSRPSMTLQTCLGAQSQYRLMVRLIEVH